MATATVHQIRLPCFGIVLHVNGSSAAIRSTMHEPSPKPEDFDDVVDHIAESRAVDRFNAKVDALEALILAHATAGVDITQRAYVDGIETAYQALGQDR